VAERKLAPLSEIPPGEGRNFDVGGLAVAVFHTRGGEVFATQAACPHRQGPLADGLLDQARVICPLHDRTYDLRTGVSVNSDCSIQVFPARVAEDGTVVLTL
jgi:nitrite reductase (NADH) small subunit